MSTPHKDEPSESPPGKSDANTLAARRTSLADLRSHLANERTHLAYVRTGISLVGFGITLNRFSLYLLQLKKLTEHEHVGVLGSSATVGTGIAVLGLLLLAWSLQRFWAVTRDIERGHFRSHFKPVVGMTLVLLTFGGASTLWLLLQ